MIFDRTVKEQAILEIRQALAAENLYESDAEKLSNLATEYDVPIEDLLRCIHTVIPFSNSIMVPFTRYCVDVKRQRDHLAEMNKIAEQKTLFRLNREAF